MKRTTIFTLLLSLLLILAACSSPPEPTPVPTPEPEPTPVPTEEVMEEEEMEEEMAEELPTIAEIAVDAGSFNTLVAALDAAGLVDTFAGEGDFTVFAPTDDAFAALPEGTVESLLEDPEGALTQILTYHVVSGAVMAETVVTLDSATTLQGEDVSIAVVDGGVVLNDAVNVVTTALQASNGVVHVIDAVLLPPSMTAEEAMEEEMMEEPKTIAEIAVEAGSFNTLVAALDAAGLVDTFAGEGDLTVFAPTDDAFAALPEGTVESLLEDPEGALTQILTYHVVEGTVLAETVVGLDSATTLQGEDVSIAVVDGGVVLNDAINVVTTDIKASNGVIHVIDAVLLPPSIAGGEEAMEEEEMMEESKTIAEIAVEAGTFNTLVAALDAAGLVDTFAGEGDFTVFAPTDDAFAALPEGTVESLLEDPEGALTQILTYHVVEGSVLAEAVVELDSATTLQGEDISIAVVDDGVVLNDAVMVVTTDIQASNGVIHVIDAVLLPPSIAGGEEAMEEEAMDSSDEGEESKTIAEIAVEAGTFNTLVAALDAAGLVDTFAGEGDFTVFAPTDDAFAALPEGTVDALLEDPTGALTNILLYHVVEGSVLAETVVTLDAATTLLGQDVTITVTDGSVFLNDTVQVTATDIKASNGVIHVIDAVLIPAE